MIEDDDYLDDLRAKEGEYVECANGSFGIIRDGKVVWTLQPNPGHRHEEPIPLQQAWSGLRRIVPKYEYVMLLLER